MKKALLPLVGLLAMAASVHAQTFDITVPNFSFENGSTDSTNVPADAAPDSTTIPGWTVTFPNPSTGESFGVLDLSTLNSAGTGAGSQAAFLQVFYGATETKISTTTSATVQANTTYTLTFAIGSPVDHPGDVGISGDDTAPQDTISLTSNGTAFASAVLTGPDTVNGTLQDFTLTFKTDDVSSYLGGTLGISLDALKDQSYPDAVNFGDPGFEETIFDNVRLTETPEPSAYALMLGGAGFLVLLARRKFGRA